MCIKKSILLTLFALAFFASGKAAAVTVSNLYCTESAWGNGKCQVDITPTPYPQFIYTSIDMGGHDMGSDPGLASICRKYPDFYLDKNCCF
jgi:hypothetical protein